ncbi:hypothetical protein ED312_15705 [Sinomicrobium pectinilyticum]|uniref:Uncharacterized protein n=1 Tax=Sinomicrobium pectinilyticum TaxID=1084421 RepID=A0A3N0E5K0_SINP1|nr:hypothetical protein [Sinomicrobium pectinilyticum]RNL83107.1 hypothetical protein ED312_15705 [Sinomicrobium pectinilyticum]
MNDALARKLLCIAADHHKKPMLMTGSRHVRPDIFLGEQDEEDYMEEGGGIMEDKTSIMNSKYDSDNGEIGVIELEEVIVVAPRKLNRWQVVKLEIRVNGRDMVNDIRNDAKQLGRWLKNCLSGPMSLRGNHMSRGIGGMGIQFISSQGKSGLTDTPVAAPGVEVITHNVDAWWDPFMMLWGPSFPVTNSTPMVPDAEGTDLWHGNGKMENYEILHKTFGQLRSGTRYGVNNPDFGGIGESYPTKDEEQAKRDSARFHNTGLFKDGTIGIKRDTIRKKN